MAWYRTGTISLTNGSTTVTGSGTTWIANAGIGEALYAPDGRLYEIANIASDTSITLGSAYLGTTASAQPYVLVPSQSYIRDLASQAADLVNNYSTIYNTVGQGKFADGTLANPAIRFSDDLDTGFFRSATNEVTFVAGGVAQFKYNTSGLQFTGAGSLVNLTTTGNTTLGDAVADTVTINGTPTINAPTVITTSSTTDALRITQTGTGNAFVIEDSASPDSTPFMVTADGKVGIGVPFPVSIPGFSNFYLSSNDGNGRPIFQRMTDDAGGVQVYLRKGRGTIQSPTIVNSGDALGAVIFAGWDSAGATANAAEITAAVDGTPGTNDMPGRLVFSTTADGASSPTERMRITSSGAISVNGAPTAGTTFQLAKNITGSTVAWNLYNLGTIQSDVTNQAKIYVSLPSTAAAAFTLPNLTHFFAQQGTFGVGSTVTSQYGFEVSNNLTGATNNFGFHSNIASGTGRWNFYANGTADNYFAGNVGIGTTTVSPIGTSTNLAMYGSASTSISFRAGAGTGGYISTDGVNYFQFMGLAATSATVLGSNNTTRLSISSAGTISLGATAGSESLRVTPVASAVNYLEVLGGATNGAVRIFARGSDTNIPIVYSSKGNREHVFYTNGDSFVQQFVIGHTASAVNYLQVTGGATGGGTVISSQGTDANIPIDYRVKGTSYHIFTTDSGNVAQFMVSHTASAVNYLRATGGTTNQAPSFTSVGSDTNIDLALSPKGTGNVRFGTLTANADAPITGYITIKDFAGNIRKLAVIA